MVYFSHFRVGTSIKMPIIDETSSQRLTMIKVGREQINNLLLIQLRDVILVYFRPGLLFSIACFIFDVST